jgi:NADH:ubiquinone oxidoreductase subunit 5 (subunit L)/multisubunit Na+/H+ antiporter MnhA subunit
VLRVSIGLAWDRGCVMMGLLVMSIGGLVMGYAERYIGGEWEANKFMIKMSGFVGMMMLVVVGGGWFSIYV